MQQPDTTFQFMQLYRNENLGIYLILVNKAKETGTLVRLHHLLNNFYTS